MIIYVLPLLLNIKPKGMLKINESNRISGKDIHSALESKNNNYSLWVSRVIQYADLQKGKDFFTVLLESTGGRPETQYEFTLDAAKEICLLERNEKGKQIRRWLIGLSTQRENLELITVKEAAFAVKVINCLKYIEYQKEAVILNKETFVAKNIDTMGDKAVYVEFYKYRNAITGWSKDKVDAAIKDFLEENYNYNRKSLEKKDMSTKLSVMDIGEAIRVATLDILYSKETDEKLADRFSLLCKNMALEMKVVAQKENKDDLFKHKEDIVNVKKLAGESKRLTD